MERTYWMTHSCERDDFVIVSSGSNMTALALARCILDDAGIAYVVRNELVQSLWGWGLLGVGYNFITGPVEILVSRENLGVARELLAQLDSISQRQSPVILRILAMADLLTTGCVVIYMIVSSFIRL
jgi:hypothetical protein